MCAGRLEQVMPVEDHACAHAGEAVSRSLLLSRRAGRCRRKARKRPACGTLHRGRARTRLLRLRRRQVARPPLALPTAPLRRQTCGCRRCSTSCRSPSPGSANIFGRGVMRRKQAARCGHKLMKQSTRVSLDVVWRMQCGGRRQVCADLIVHESYHAH